MKNKEEIIKRAEIVLCVSDRCYLERSSKEHSFKERCEQRLVIADWLEANGLYEYMENRDKLLFEKKVGNIFYRNIFNENKFQHEALEPLLWSLGLIPRMTSYSQYSLTDFHVMMCTNVPNTIDEMMKKTVMKSEEDIEFRRKIAMLWHWRAIEGTNQIFKHESIGDILLQIFGDEYKKAINYIMKNQTNKQDFCFHDKPIYKFDDFFIRHLYKRTLWRYHAFQWIVSCEDWYDVSTDT